MPLIAGKKSNLQTFLQKGLQISNIRTPFTHVETKGNEPFTRLLRVRALLGFPEASVSGLNIFNETQEGKCLFF